jgi:hypothetical protein
MSSGRPRQSTSIRRSPPSDPGMGREAVPNSNPSIRVGTDRDRGFDTAHDAARGRDDVSRGGDGRAQTPAPREFGAQPDSPTGRVTGK